MEFALNQSRIEQLLRQRNFGMLVNVGLFAICFLLVLALYSSQGKQRIVVIPTNLDSQIWLDNKAVSASYLAQMSQYYTLLRFNITPANAEKQHALLLRHVAPKFYGAVNSQLASEFERIKKYHISTVFYPVDTKVNPKHFIVEITGELVSTIGKEILPTKRFTYRIQYQYRYGRLLVLSFEEVNNDK